MAPFILSVEFIESKIYLGKNYLVSNIKMADIFLDLDIVLSISIIKLIVKACLNKIEMFF